jgi:hypothetical protein
MTVPITRPRLASSAKSPASGSIASALPQTAAPAVGAFLLAVGSAQSQNYGLLLYAAGALALIGPRHPADQEGPLSPCHPTPKHREGNVP